MAITKIGTPELFDFSATNTALQLPSGDTASRPSAPSAGEWRYNTEKKYVEYWDGGSPGAWRQIDTEALPNPDEFNEQNFNVNTYYGTGAAQTIDAKFNEAANFNGSSTQIEASGLTGTVLPTNGNWSVGFWMKPQATTTSAVVSLMTSSGTGWAVFTEANVVQVALNGSTPAASTGGFTTAALNTWMHVTLTFNSSTTVTSIYYNGGSSGADATINSGPSAATSATLKMGYSVWNYFEGQIDQVRLFNTTLSDAQVTDLYTNETTTTAATLDFPVGAGCIAAYQLDGDASDVGGNYNGTAISVGYTGLQFQPDMIWIKTRNQANDHNIVDSIRGTTKYVRPNRNIAEVTQSDGVTSFDTNGFTVGVGGDFGGSNNEYVAWSFKGGGAPTTDNVAGVGVTPTPNSAKIDGANSTTALIGTIAATRLSANTEAGFSIVSYEGNGLQNATVDSGLQTQSNLVIIKNLDQGDAWFVGSTVLSTDNFLELNEPTGAATNSDLNYTINTKTIQFTSASPHDMFNENGENYVMYSFQNKNGYQRISTYTGNNSTYGEFVYTTSDGTATGTDGFEPAFLLVKRTTAGQTANWRIVDNKRSTQNPRQIALFPNLSNAEDDNASQRVNFFTNGFQIANSDASWNASGETYLYLAIGSNPAPTPTATNSFDLTTYNGTSSSPQFVTSASLYPQIIWNKQTGGSAAHRLLDQLRGSGNYLYPSEVNANDGYNADYIRFQKDGDDGTVTGLYLPGADSNFNTSEWVNWFWKAGTPSFNNDGTLTSITSVNEAAGFSIVQWKGDGNAASTVGHGIAAGAPDFVAYKDSSNSRHWNVYVSSASASYNPFGGTLDLDSAFNTSGGTNGSSGTPTATTLTFTAGSSTVDTVNANAAIMMAYCWKSTTNYVDVGSYTGAVGRTVNVGFQPRFVLIKKVNAAYNWSLYDSIRGSSGALTDRYLLAADANSPQVTSSSVYIDFTSTGLSFPNSYSGTNNTGDEYIYIAFA
tara:strand:- start:757 stop:3729 length:2973 start_codon:yes stop_codon:yes gene_type:complete